MTKRITIEAWINLNYDGPGSPSIHTVRRWISDGRIWPLPEKHGRTYYLSTKAEYIVENRVANAA